MHCRWGREWVRMRKSDLKRRKFGEEVKLIAKMIRHRICVSVRLIFGGQWRRVWENRCSIFDTKRSMTAETIDRSEIVVVSPSQTQYIANIIKNELIKKGHTVHICRNFSRKRDKGQFHIIIVPQVYKWFPWNFMVYQLEQLEASLWLTKRYFCLLERAIKVFDYSERNINLLKEIDYCCPDKLHFSPIYPVENYNDDILKLDNCYGEKDIDILFYGTVLQSERRVRYLAELEKQFNIRIVTEVFGDEVLFLIQRAKIVVNIHYYENALLETTRISEALSLGAVIVSEKSVDMDTCEEFEEAVIFASVGDVDEFVEKCGELLNDKEKYNEQVLKVDNFISNGTHRFVFSIEE